MCPTIFQDIFQARHLYLAGRITRTEFPTEEPFPSQAEVCLQRASQGDTLLTILVSSINR